MLELLKTNLVKPLAGRLGTAAAAWLLTLGVSGPLAQQIAVGVTAVALLTADLVLSWIGRREVVNKTLSVIYPDLKGSK